MTVHHLSAPTKPDLVAQIAALTEKAVEAGLAWRVTMQHPVGGGYTAIVTVEDGE